LAVQATDTRKSIFAYCVYKFYAAAVQLVARATDTRLPARASGFETSLWAKIPAAAHNQTNTEQKKKRKNTEV